MEATFQWPCPAFTSYIRGYWERYKVIKPGQNLQLAFGCTGRSHRVFFLENQAGRFELLNTFFKQRLCIGLHPDKLINAAVNLIQQQPGKIRIRQLARQLNCTERTLNRRFTKAVGLSPKEYARVQRFLLARRWLEHYPYGSWTDLVNKLGFFDQAHFIHEFHHFAGLPPLAYKKAVEARLVFFTP